MTGDSTWWKKEEKMSNSISHWSWSPVCAHITDWFYSSSHQRFSDNITHWMWLTLLPFGPSCPSHIIHWSNLNLYSCAGIRALLVLYHSLYTLHIRPFGVRQFEEQEESVCTNNSSFPVNIHNTIHCVILIIMPHWLNGCLLLNLPLGRTDKSAAPACRQWQRAETQTLYIWQREETQGVGGGGGWINQKTRRTSSYSCVDSQAHTVHSLQLDDNLSGLPRQIAHIPVAIKVGN